MGQKARKYCAAFPCRYLAEDGPYCHRHRPAPAPKETDPFYLSVAWRRFREWYISGHPLCEQCEADGRQDTPAQMVDHIIEIEDGGELTSEANALSMCWKCHGIKTSMTKNHRKCSIDNRVGSTRETYYG